MSSGVTAVRRRYPIGAELVSDAEASVRVWAPSTSALDLWIDGSVGAMTAQANGYFSATVAAHAGSRYGFRFPSDDRLYPDPASNSQPEGPEAPSEIVDPARYQWGDAAWQGVQLRGQVLYEFHVGTFTSAGTWRAAEAQLPRLCDIGITVLQMMPIGEFAGAFGWGYDGVQWFAPTHLYGTPSDLQHFIDRAHALGLGVILDVVYNHVGPSGNFLSRFAPQYFTDKYVNEWGEALNFDGEGSAAVRELVLSNVSYWLREFHFDGLRLDATQQIYDASSEHLVAAIARIAREAAAPKSVIVIAEHEPQHASLMRPAASGGYALDGVFNEDFHHSMRVTLTGARDAYCSDYLGVSYEWLGAIESGFLFQGQYYTWQTARRGAPGFDCPRWQFICFLENHDQVANSTATKRLIDLTSPAWWRAMTGLLLLGPWTPMLFQGQEHASSTPFRYFADHERQLQQAVLEGRRRFVSQFSRAASSTPAMSVDDIGRNAFEASRLTNPSEARAEHASRLCRDLLALRHRDPSLADRAARMMGATLGDRAILVRYLGADSDRDRLLIVNLGPDTNIASLAQPLVAPPPGRHWSLLWCSEDQQYGGAGAAASSPPSRILATGHATTLFEPRPMSP